MIFVRFYGGNLFFDVLAGCCGSLFILSGVQFWFYSFCPKFINEMSIRPFEFIEHDLKQKSKIYLFSWVENLPSTVKNVFSPVDNIFLIVKNLF